VQENERFLPPTQIQTSTPYISLKELSKQYSVPVDFIDFKLSNILTYYKNKDNVEPVFVPEENLSFFDDNTFYLDETLEIEQVYDVEFFDVRLNATPKLPKIDIGVNSTITKVIAKVRASKECEYEQHYEDKAAYEGSNFNRHKDRQAKRRTKANRLDNPRKRRA